MQTDALQFPNPLLVARTNTTNSSLFLGIDQIAGFQNDFLTERANSRHGHTSFGLPTFPATVICSSKQSPYNGNQVRPTVSDENSHEPQDSWTEMRYVSNQST